MMKKTENSRSDARQELQSLVFGPETEEEAKQGRDPKQLQQAQQLLLATLEASSNAICLVQNNQFVWCNAAASQILKWGHRELPGKPLALIFKDQKDLEQTNRLIQKKLAVSKIVSFEREFLTKDKETLTCHVSLCPVDTRNLEKGCIFCLTDISARVEAEKQLATNRKDFPKEVQSALKKSEQLHRMFLDRIPDPVVVYDMEGRTIYSNPAFEATFGWTEKEILGKRVEFVPDQAREETRRAIGQMMQGKPVVRLETSRLTKDGRLLAIHLDTASFFDHRGVQVGNVVLLRDVTGLKRAQTQLRKSEEQNRAILESAADPMVVYDQKGKVIYFNRAFARVFGWKLTERKGRKLDDFVPQENWPETLEMINKAKRGKSFIGVESRRYNSQGEIIPVSVSGSALHSEDGTPMGSIITLRDISETKKLEAQLIQSQKMDAMGTLAGGVAHEFNNILMAIRGYAQLLTRNKNLDPAVARYLAKIDQSTQRAADLTSNMLNFSRQETGDQAPVDLNHILKTLNDLLQQTLPPNIRIEQELAPDLPLVRANSNQLEQVFLNLALNARDALPSGGAITFRTGLEQLGREFCRTQPWARPGAYVKVEVADTGEGIQEEQLKHIFEPFYTTKEPGKGTGLGLSVVYSVVKNHAGGILAESHPDHGSVFRVYLPSQDGLDQETAPPRQTERPQQRGDGRKVLVVEDELAVREITREALEAFGYSVMEAGQGSQALEIFQNELSRGQPFDLVILDLSMPVMDGEECLRRMLEIEPGARVLISTGHMDDQEQCNQAIKLARGVLHKPYDLNQLIQKVEQIIN